MIWMSMSVVLVKSSGSWLYQTSLDIPCSAARCGDSELHAVFSEVFSAHCVVSRNDLSEAPGAWNCQTGFGAWDVNLVQPSTGQYHQHHRHRTRLVFQGSASTGTWSMIKAPSLQTTEIGASWLVGHLCLKRKNTCMFIYSTMSITLQSTRTSTIRVCCVTIQTLLSVSPF